MLHQRGTVIALTDSQIVTRWLYLAGLRKLADLDDNVRKDDAPEVCPSLYYLLHDHNGGKDPTAPDPADRWSNVGSTFVNRTADCVSCIAWGGGWDRYQPQRAAHIPGYDGWLNTDSIRWEARNAGRCFKRLTRPEPGAIIVYASDPEHHSHGIPVGHCGGITAYHAAEWNPDVSACWEAIEVVNIAAYRDAKGNPEQANRLTSGAHWFGKDAWFLRSIMQP